MAVLIRQTAWAEGGITPREPELIIKATLRAIGAILQTQPPEVREKTARDLVALSAAIASASGGIMGFHAVSDAERQILAHISEELEKGGKR